jgi:hypothetical protein
MADVARVLQSAPRLISYRKCLTTAGTRRQAYIRLEAEQEKVHTMLIPY